MKELLKRSPKIYEFARFIHSLPRRTSHLYKRTVGSYKLKHSAQQPQIKIVVGSSGIFDVGWTPTDVEYLDLTKIEDWKKHFKESSIDAILSEHVWEHLTLQDGLTAAKICFQYLKPDGYLRVAVPDGYHTNKEYIDWVKVNGSGEGAYDHKVLYNHESFYNLFKEAGFQVDLLEYFDKDGSFHRNEWDVKDGKIHRTSQFDDRNKYGQLNYTSLIIDAKKITS